MKATARKSYGEYKPIIVFDSGRTEICGKNGRVVHEQAQTQFGYSSSRTIYQRGVTFRVRQDAVDYAQVVIERRQRNIIINQYQFDTTGKTGRRPSREAAIEALGI